MAIQGIEKIVTIRDVYYIPTYAQISGVNLYYNYSDMFRC